MIIKKIFYLGGWISIILAVVILFLVFYWLLFPYNPVKFIGNIKTTKTVYKVDDIVEYKIKYCKYMNIGTMVSRAFIDGVIYAVPLTHANNPIGCRDQNYSIRIPNIPEGNYKIRIYYTYEVNPLKSITYMVDSNNFKLYKNRGD